MHGPARHRLTTGLRSGCSREDVESLRRLSHGAEAPVGTTGGCVTFIRCAVRWWIMGTLDRARVRSGCALRPLQAGVARPASPRRPEARLPRGGAQSAALARLQTRPAGSREGRQRTAPRAPSRRPPPAPGGRWRGACPPRPPWR